MGPSAYTKCHLHCIESSPRKKYCYIPFIDEGAGSDGLSNSPKVTVRCGSAAEFTLPVN